MTVLKKEDFKEGDKQSLLKKIINDEKINEEVSKELVKAETNEKFVEILMENNPNTDIGYFLNDYYEWVFEPTKNLKLTSYKSRFQSFLASFVYGTPESQGSPFYYYFGLQDKVVSAPFHFRTDEKKFGYFRLFTNRKTKLFRQGITNLLATGLIIFGLLMGFVIKPAILEFKDQVQKIKDISVIEENGQKRYEDFKALISEQKSKNLDKAKVLKTQYESGEITAEDFNAKAEEIKKIDTQLNDKQLKFKITSEAQTEIDVALRKKKDSEYIENIRKERDEALKQFENKGI